MEKNLVHADKALQLDQEICFAAIKQDTKVIFKLDKSLKADYKFMLKILNHDASLFGFSDHWLKTNPNFIHDYLSNITHKYSK